MKDGKERPQCDQQAADAALRGRLCADELTQASLATKNGWLGRNGADAASPSTRALRLAKRSLDRLPGLSAATRTIKAVLPERHWTRLRNRVRMEPTAVSQVQPMPSVDVSPVVDIIVPVYGAFQATRACIESVVASQTTTAAELIVIDDASPDEELGAWLQTQAQSLGFTLLRNELNLGFVRTVNRGLNVHPDRDVIVLNSDTEVHGDWVDRLRRAAHQGSTIGTATPFSNDATICSYPRFCESNPLPQDAPTVSDLDRLCASTNSGRVLDIPTAIGFCMYVKRRCLADVGLLDAELWGRGYGEENDFCMRAHHRGWRNVVAADVFVYHRGGASFGTEKSPALETAIRELNKQHPGYLPAVRSFIARDPVLPLRRNLDLARLNSRNEGVLLITHQWDGGTQRHIDDLAARMAIEGLAAFLLRPTPAGQLALTRYGVCETPNLRFDLPHEYDVLASLLRRLKISLVHIHSTLGLSRWLQQLPTDLERPYDCTVHDYFWICPRINLIDGSGRYCGEPSDKQCTQCVEKNGSPIGNRVEVSAWRAANNVLLNGARRVLVPSHDVKQRLSRYFAEAHFAVRPHFESAAAAAETKKPRMSVPRRRVAVIGAIGLNKGYEILVACARDARRRRLPIDFVVVGYTCNDKAIERFSNVEITGQYSEGDVFHLLATRECDLALLPSVWPETYCYTLSIAVQAGLVPVVLDLGAPAERLRALDWGLVLPLESTAQQINDALLAADLSPALPGRLEGWTAEYGSLREDYYGL